MSLVIIGTIVGIVVALMTILGGLIAIAKIFGKLNVLTEGVLGKPAVKDFAGEVVEPAIPSLQARVSKIEQLVITTHEYDARLTALETWTTHHDHN